MLRGKYGATAVAMPFLRPAPSGKETTMKRSPHLKLGATRLPAATIALLIAGSLAFLPHTTRAESAPSFDVDLKAATAGYRASKLIYRPVLNDRSEIVGSLEDIIIGADGKANFALLDVGSVSLGPHIVVIPFERLKIDKTQGTIILPGVVKSDLQKLALFP
jgi:hypothetical protein